MSLSAHENLIQTINNVEGIHYQLKNEITM